MSYIGYSLKDVSQSLDQKGFIVKKGWTTDNVFYITGKDQESLRIYYFTKNNVCVMYALTYFNWTLNDIEQSLVSTGYVKNQDGHYYDQMHKATAVWLSEYEAYFIIIIPQLN